MQPKSQALVHASLLSAVPWISDRVRYAAASHQLRVHDFMWVYKLTSPSPLNTDSARAARHPTLPNTFACELVRWSAGMRPNRQANHRLRTLCTNAMHATFARTLRSNATTPGPILNTRSPKSSPRLAPLDLAGYNPAQPLTAEVWSESM